MVRAPGRRPRPRGLTSACGVREGPAQNAARARVGSVPSGGTPYDDRMALLPRISSPADVRALRPAELVRLAAEIRDFLVQSVSRTGGHLGPNLGVVELTLAVHRVFESPRDTIVFDTGHQAYVHKLITGRSDFSGLRQRGGLSGYPNRSESEHDVVENSHASTALSWADGIAKAYALRGSVDRHVVAVIGDGALTGGHGLGGAEQHRSRAGPAPGHRGERQRAVLRPDHRRAGRAPRPAAHRPRLRGRPGLGQAHPAALRAGSAG